MSSKSYFLEKTVSIDKDWMTKKRASVLRMANRLVNRDDNPKMSLVLS